MLHTTFLNKTFSNPIVLASGILGVTGASLAHMVENGCGGVTTKSISLEPRPGHKNPTMMGTDDYFLNAVGLSNPGVANALPEIAKFHSLSTAPIIASIFAGTADEFGEVAEHICASPIDFIEVNISCPNVGKEFGTPFAYSTTAIEAITKIVKSKSTVPIIIKLSPNAWNIAEMAKAAEAAGADAITAVNTISGLMIDIESRRPILANKQGGVSGPALLPIALKCVYDIYASVKIPIIGTGGVTTGRDAIAMIMAGATLVGVGSAAYYREKTCFAKIVAEMAEFMQTENIKSLAEIRGAAHTN
ncbi:MAG: dihydroorotate dehydrogenase B catalytic subunit [Candidatus Magasanikbacteria bacterium RIFOXYC2_FULL_42_28]|uniref:Dihydroorotate dehydrogenase n=1 Tax=Candidatus Magasanikbacteria bacterium RIFOXYC2_FULL_42_28 TaxID=1798704 RepID=A0A1F6NUE8_9BACT|nr:MAG: dihydroorotate dehydrogenase B catalytic subunit [Candidatus Magasanikbacteria bacterium RIFOXYC2_FULL_42_28]